MALRLSIKLIALMFLVNSGVAFAHTAQSSPSGLTDHQHYHCHHQTSCHSHNHDDGHH